MRIPRLNRLLASGAVFTVALAFCAMQQPSGAQVAIGPITQTFTSSGSPPIKACSLRGENSATFQATGSGPIDAQVSNDGVSWTTATISTVSGATQAQPFSPTSGTVYQVTPLGADCVQISPDTTWSTQNVTVTFKASGAIAALPTPVAAGTGTSTVACASPGCVIASPLPNFATTQPVSLASLPPPVQPSPIYTQPVTTPAPQPTVSPGGWVGNQMIKYGTGATYVDPIGDTFAKSGSIVTAVTTLLISGVANQSIYIWLAGFQSTGTNASNTVSFEYGQGATCQTNTVVMNPSLPAPATSAGGWVSGWSAETAGAAAATVGMLPPAAVPLVLPNNSTPYNFCGVTAGTTTSGVFVTVSAVH